MAGLSELHSTCPQDCFHGKHLLWKKKQFSICISQSRRKLFRFSAKLFHHGSRNFIGFQVFQSDLCQVFSDFTQNFFGWSVRTALYVSTGLFSWEASSLKKTLFQLYFTFLAETFQIFDKSFPSRYSKLHWFLGFSNYIVPFFSDFAQKFIDRSVRISLYVSTGLFFMRSIFFEKKKHFSNCISEFKQKFFRFLGKSFPARYWEPHWFLGFSIGFMPICFGLHAKCSCLVC